MVRTTGPDSAQPKGFSLVNKVFASWRDRVRSQLWPLPVIGVVLAFSAGVALPRIDAYLDTGLPPWVTSVLFGGDASAARTLLDAISSSLITVTALTFSLTVVTLQLASTQFSPRLLRTFTSDVFVQMTLAMFLSTFTYALTVLRSVRSGGDGTAFVPRISVTVAFVLAIVSVLGLVLFLAHLARQIRVETMLRDVHDAASQTVLTTTRPLEEAEPHPTVPDAPDDAHPIIAPASGFLTRIEEATLRSAAVDLNAYLIIDCDPGSSLIEGVPIGQWWSADRKKLSEGAFERLQDAVRQSIRTGYERTAAQDVCFGLRQLTDVANKALSPGINDPTTAIHALGHISALLCQLADRDLGPELLRDDDDQVRVVLHRPGFADILDLSIAQPRRYGSSDPQVMTRLFRLLEEVGWHLADPSPVLSQLHRLRRTVAESNFDDTELAQLDRAARRVESAAVGQDTCQCHPRSATCSPPCSSNG